MTAKAMTAESTVKAGWKLAETGTSGKRDRLAECGYATDAALVAACRRGEPGAFDALMHRHQRHVYQVCYRFVSNHEDASDLTQDVFLRVHRGLRRFKGDAALSTWIYRIAVNVSLNHVGAKRPVIEDMEMEALHDRRAESPVDRVARGERSNRIRAAIARLPEKQRVTLILRVYQELTHREIADILGKSVGGVKANFFHALASLKKQLADTKGSST